jgi:hypothetical protein
MTWATLPGSRSWCASRLRSSPTSWASQADIRLAAFAQAPIPVWPSEVYQAAMISWPLPGSEHPAYSSGFEDGTTGSWSAVSP